MVAPTSSAKVAQLNQQDGGVIMGVGNASSQPAVPGLPVGPIMEALKAGEKAADNGPTWAMVYSGALLILLAIVLFGIVPLSYTAHGILLESAPYIATLIVGSALILLAGILRLLNEVSCRRQAQAQAKAYYEELDRAREHREQIEREDIAAIRQQRKEEIEGAQPNPRL